MLSFLTSFPAVLSWRGGCVSSGISWKKCWAINRYFEGLSCLRWALSRAALDCYFSFPQHFVCLGPGFSIELDRVKNLPYCETETFEVRFDTQGGNVSVGNKEVILPIKVRRATGSSWSSQASSPACWPPCDDPQLFQSHDSSSKPVLCGNSNFMPTLGGWRATSSYLSPSQGDHSQYDTVLWKSGVCHNSVWTVSCGNYSAFQSSPSPLWMVCPEP